MATYIIVDQDKDPLEPGEVHAGSNISVADGDVYIVDPSVDSDVTFVSSDGSPKDFDVQFNDSNLNEFNLKFEEDLTPTVTLADDVDALYVDIDAKSADEFTFAAGDDVDFGKLEGTSTGDNTIAVGDDFFTDSNWVFAGDHVDFVAGDDATFQNITTGDGDDSIVFGDRATLHDLSAKGGNDTIIFGDDATAHDIKGNAGNDTFSFGNRSNVSKIEGGSGDDTYTTQTAGTTHSEMETVNVVCFARGTLIATKDGQVAVENLRAGDVLQTQDHGLQRLRWVGSSKLSAEVLIAEPRLRPIRISAGALGHARPTRDLIVSPQHRILIRSRIVQRMFDVNEVFVAAKALIVCPDVRAICPPDGVEYFHLLMDAHNVILSEGAMSESLLLGPEVGKTLDVAARAEIAKARRRKGVDQMCIARRTVGAGMRAQHLVARHAKNRKALCDMAREPLAV